MKPEFSTQFEVLVLAPFGRDAAAAAEVLGSNGIHTEPVRSTYELCERIKEPVGALLIAEEALTPESIRELNEALSKQEPWSNLPIILMTSQTRRNFTTENIVELFGNSVVTLLERPFRILTLVSSVRVVLQARKKQYEVRELLLKQKHAVEVQRLATHTIQTQKERFNRLTAASGIGVWYCDLPFSELIWDEKVKEHFWLPAAARVTINTFYERIHPEDQEPTRQAIESSMQSHTRYDFVYRTTNPENETDIKWIRAIGWTDYDQTGKPIRFDGMTLDITASKIYEQALAESENRHRLLSEKMLQGVVHHRRDGTILALNPSARRILGVSTEDLFNPLYGYPEHPNIREDGSSLPIREHPVMLAMKTGKPVSGMVLGIYNTQENSYRWIEKDAVPLYRSGESTPYEVFAIFSDITDRKRIEAELRRTSENLSKSVSDLVLERDLRERFVATLTHDLRTPITAARLSSQLILRKAASQEQVESLASRSIHTLDRVNDMIQDLLDANLIRTGRQLPVERSEFDLNQLISDTLEELRTLHGDRIELTVNGDGTGFWSRSGLRRILENLVNNAAKYGAKSSPIRVSLLNEQEQVHLSVQNEGTAIPKAEQLQLFVPFQRAHAAQAGTQKGWGLGLTLVKGIAEAHGGKVELKSDAESGTTFSVTLPRDARLQEKSIAPQPLTTRVLQGGIIQKITPKKAF